MKRKRIASLGILCCLILPSVLSSCNTEMEQGDETGRDNVLYTSGDLNDNNAVSAGAQTDVPDTDRREFTNGSSDTDAVRFSFVAAGDNVIHESVFVDAKNRAISAASIGTYSGTYYFDEMYLGIKDLISSAGIAYINQEGPVAGDSLGVSGYPAFNAPEEIGDALINTGFDIVNLANNHMLDMDNSNRTGYKHTIDYWKTKNVMTIGAYESEEDYETIRIFEKDGIKIALLSYTYGTNGNKLSSASPGLVVPYIDDATITRHITAAKEQADLVFVSMHWGLDTAGSYFNNYPTNEQKELAQLIADLGADVTIGMQPHVIQPMTWLTGTSGNKTLVTYSIGNLLSTMLHIYNNVGGILSFDVVKDKSGNVYVDAPYLLPVVCHYTADPSVIDSLGYASRSELALYMLEDYTSELASNHGSKIYDSFTLDTIYGYVTDTIAPEFLPDYLK